jgi:hypothetical protein
VNGSIHSYSPQVFIKTLLCVMLWSSYEAIRDEHDKLGTCRVPSSKKVSWGGESHNSVSLPDSSSTLQMAICPCNNLYSKLMHTLLTSGFPNPVPSSYSVFLAEWPPTTTSPGIYNRIEGETLFFLPLNQQYRSQSHDYHKFYLQECGDIIWQPCIALELLGSFIENQILSFTQYVY